MAALASASTDGPAQFVAVSAVPVSDVTQPSRRQRHIKHVCCWPWEGLRECKFGPAVVAALGAAASQDEIRKGEGEGEGEGRKEKRKEAVLTWSLLA